ncbi:cytochrome P450 [Kibdelosporangium phytohabitans]|uniref:Cytochrome n=1 Tax=Kibdelosporangium phytohabitans TaxID=860235 RepID=A0A0N9HRU0_9PSEU|nr:cytochrome P450 [Kibdelosporangium phytohabitans]ALG09902.1 cytochrome [Kibdelosporangium phytohabitans]MBE1468695.1 cytochrome P450 [Kibdelosporangium phytohabitans]
MTLIPVPAPDPGTAGPPRAYDRLRADEPVVQAQLANGETGWLLSRHEDVRAAFADPRLVRPLLSAWPVREDAQPPPCLPTFLEMTGEQHHRVRRAVLPLFTRPRLRFMAPRIRAIATELVDAMTAAGTAADLVPSFVEPLPLRVLCDTVGLPYEDRDTYLPHTLTLLSAAGLPMDDVLDALYALQDYASELVSRKQREPDDTYICLLLSRLTRDDVVSFVVTMLMAGYKTNVQHTGNALLVLLTHPGQLGLLRADPARIPVAVEELLRYVPLMNAINILVAQEDLTLRGRRIRAGDAVLPVIASANRDPAAFTDPDRLDLARSPNPHTTFGRGPHHCTGAHLTRLQLTVALEVLLSGLPDLELDEPPEVIPWDESTPLRAPARLRVRW